MRSKIKMNICNDLTHTCVKGCLIWDVKTIYMKVIIMHQQMK